MRLDDERLVTLLEATPYMQIFKSLIRLLQESKLKREAFDTFVLSNQQEIDRLTQEMRKHKLTDDVAAFFIALQAEVAPQKLLFHHFKKRIYPHDVMQSVSSIRAMVQENRRVNLPSGVVTLTGEPTIQIEPSPPLEDAPNSEDSEEAPIAETADTEYGRSLRFDGILKAYIQTSESLTKDALTELHLFRKLVL